MPPLARQKLSTALPEIAVRVRPAPRPALRTPRRFAAIELGNEPPIGQGAPSVGEGHRPSVNLRWLGASVLTGFAGFLLLGSAIYVSSQGEVTFADYPERAAPSPSRGGESSDSGAARKSDKLVRSEMVAAAKQTFRSPVTIRVSDREVIKVRTFTRISTGLSMTSGLYATDIPPFDPLRLFAEGGADRTVDAAPPETSDAEVSVSKSDLSTLAVDPSATTLRDDQVIAQMEEEARLRGDASRRSLPTPASVLLMRALGPTVQTALEPLGPAFSGSGIFRQIEVRVVPENVTSFDKAPQRGAGSQEERNVSIRHADTVEALLRANGASPEEARAAAAILVGRDRSAASLEGMQLRLLVGPSLTGGPARPVLRAVLLSERGIEAIAAMNDRGAFVSVTPPQIQATKPDPAQPHNDDSDDDDEGSGPTLYNSLYETAAKQEIPRATVDDLVRIFAYDVDFQRRVSTGDSFDLFYASDEEGATDRLEVLTAALTIGGEVHRVYRYQDLDSSVDFFDEAGRSLKKFLLRKPVVEARMSSPFGVRFHPILGYTKMHTGVDWAAPWGTPIFATGNGTVIKAEMSSGYGRRIELQHSNGYVSTYNHMSAFARGLVPGAKIRQGQIVGYVGSIGLSTGPHVHYEVIVNGHFVDPMKIRVPRGRELDGRALTDFSRQRDGIDQLLQKASGSNRVAQSDTR